MKLPLLAFFLAFSFSVIGVRAAEPKMCGAATGPALPHGTSSKTNPDGSMAITVPKNWYMFVNNNGRWEISPSAVLRCSCEEGGGGCHPTLLPNGQAFCAMDTCSTCSKSGALAFYPVNEDHEGITFASKDELHRLPSADATLLSIPEIQEDIAAFKQSLGIPQDAKGSQSVFVRIYGYIAPMEWPDGMQLKMTDSRTKNIALGLLATTIVSVPTATVSCSCESGGSCPLESNYGVKVCRATSCATCTMRY